MRIRVFYLALLILVSLSNADAQSYKKDADLEAYRHHLSYVDHQVSFFTLRSDEGLGQAKLGRNYYWLAGRQINVTSGGYSGKLLHGRFTSFYLNKQMKEQGDFRKGLKQGEWKKWNEDGSLALRIHYNNGLESGSFYKYNEKGILIEEGNYFAGKLDGKLKKNVNPDSVVILRYRNGLEYQKSGIPWWKFWKKHK